FYVQKGVKGESSAGTGSFSLGYIEVPVLLKLRMPAKGNGSQFSPHVYGGGAIGFKAGCTIKAHPTGGSESSESCKVAGSEQKSTDWSIVVGAGVDIGRAILDARYDIGLATIDASSNPEDIKNRAFYLLVGWTFRSPR
ncbi:MAG TPA: outer membrane beta-barrel protein, partial [Gemmatimonadales bacterium]|nr:outer membrane beta-barrel protein [Gemmatimonadales bacterium]